MPAFFLAIAFAVSAFMSSNPAAAQEGCKQVQISCSQMNQNCERNCQNANNSSACAARVCAVNMNNCKANGIWKPQGGAACWKTNNRS